MKKSQKKKKVPTPIPQSIQERIAAMKAKREAAMLIGTKHKK